MRDLLSRQPELWSFGGYPFSRTKVHEIASLYLMAIWVFLTAKSIGIRGAMGLGERGRYRSGFGRRAFLYVFLGKTHTLRLWRLPPARSLGRDAGHADSIEFSGGQRYTGDSSVGTRVACLWVQTRSRSTIVG